MINIQCLRYCLTFYPSLSWPSVKVLPLSVNRLQYGFHLPVYIASNYSNTRGRRLHQKHKRTRLIVDVNQREQLTANYIAMCKSINIVYLVTMLNRVGSSRSCFTDYSGLTPCAKLNVDVLLHVIV